MKWFILGLIGLLSFLAFLIASAPASLLISMLEEDISHNAPDVSLGMTQGSMWDGTQQLQYRQFPPLQMQWNLSVLPLITGAIESQNQLTGDNLDANFALRISGNEGEISRGNANISGQYLNHVTVPLGLDLSEAFKLSELDVAWTGNWVTSISGRINWPGGIVHIETPQGLHTTKLPPLLGILSLEDDDIRLNVNSGETELIDIRLQADGWARVEINHPLIAMTGIAFSDSQQPKSGPAVILEEKVF